MNKAPKVKTMKEDDWLSNLEIKSIEKDCLNRVFSILIGLGKRNIIHRTGTIL